MVKGLAHVCFGVADVEASIVFYRDKMGMAEAFSFVNDKGVRYGVYMHVGGRNFIELFQRDKAAPPPGEAPSFRHICIEVQDVQAAATELRAKGVEVTEPKLGSDRSWQAWIADPDGNRIELHGYTPQSKQAPWLK